MTNLKNKTDIAELQEGVSQYKLDMIRQITYKLKMIESNKPDSECEWELLDGPFNDLAGYDWDTKLIFSSFPAAKRFIIINVLGKVE